MGYRDPVTATKLALKSLARRILDLNDEIAELERFIVSLVEELAPTLECELRERRRFRSHAEARMAVFEFIEERYNPRRRHSAIGCLSPVNYERSKLPPARTNP